MSALDDLIAAVEVGTHNRDVYDLAVAAGMDQDAVDNVCAANDGYLDAAKALHEALLPGWSAAVNTNGMAHVIGPEPDWSRHTGCAVDNPARAWLLAILKAWRSQQPEMRK